MRLFMTIAASIFLAAIIVFLPGCIRQSEKSDQEAASSGPLSLEEQGRRAFRQCAVCHSVAAPSSGGAQRFVGPNLWGIIGRRAGTQRGFTYSPAILSTDLVWTEENLATYIENPQAFIRGNRMSFTGERSAEKRDAIVAFLATLK